MTSEEAAPNRGGRPKGPTGQAKKLRSLRMGPLWDRAEALATELATRDGKTKGNVTAYVEEALRRENARVERLLDRDVRPDPNHACAAHDDAHLGHACPDLTP